MHANVIKPTVDRLLFKWENRTLDFNTWSPSEPFFGEPAVVTIHKAGDSLKNEQMESKIKDESDWKEKLVVDDVKFKTHRYVIRFIFARSKKNTFREYQFLRISHVEIFREGFYFLRMN